MAGEVFGQSGLGREDLMKIWYVSQMWIYRLKGSGISARGGNVEADLILGLVDFGDTGTCRISIIGAN